MKFGTYFRKGVDFLRDTLQKLNSFAPAVKNISKGVGMLGVGGARLADYANRGLDLVKKTTEVVEPFSRLSPEEQAKKLGQAAGGFATSALQRLIA